ncbi:lipase, partial [Helicobacter sp. faydin-H17]|nr:lipase [Helicobacter kayseriensis]MCE3049181.1 lipase [Helicobacter kayseriensis]
MEDKRSLYKALPFEIQDENGKFLDKDSLYECYSYHSNFAICALNKENSEFFKAKKKQMANFLYDQKCTSFYIKEDFTLSENKINSMSSTIYVNQEDKELYIFAKQFDNLDCEKVFEEIKKRLELTESIEELKRYKPKLFFH